MLASLLRKSSKSVTSSPVWTKRLYSVDKNCENAMPRNYRSSLFIPIRENVTKETKSISHRYLLKSGFIRQSASGIYSYLPLGLRVLEKLTKIIDEEMRRVGGQKLSMPVMMTAELWKTTGRWDKNGSEMIKFKDRKGEEYCLGPTHEELITQIVANDVFSYKNLPLRLYQIGEKFRDEVRPRHGLIRCREFIMKDMYSFDATQEQALKTYEDLVKAYHRIMKRIGIPYVVAEADTGNIGGDLSHEFHIPAALGDDTLLKCNCCGYAGNVEKARHKPEKPLSITHVASFNNFEEMLKIFANPEHSSEITLSSFKVDEKKQCILFHHKNREPNSYAIKNGVKGIEEVVEEIPDLNKMLSTAPENRIILFDESLQGQSNAILQEIQKVESISKAATTNEIQWSQFHKTRQGDACPQENCNGTLEESKGIEVGHCFYLGKKYSSVLDAKIRTADQTQTVLEMGCYGIGVSRLISAISESQHDQKGVAWPFSVAPYRVTILPFKSEYNEVADQVYDLLEQDPELKGEQIIDNRDETAGVRLHDASMIGSPFLIIIGKKYAAEKQLEIEIRKTGQRHFVTIDDLPRVIRELKKST